MKAKITINPIAVASLSIALTCATLLPAQAGTFRRSIWTVNAQGTPVTQIGLIDFSWNDSDVVNNMISGYDKLTRFSYTDQLGVTYDKAFALNSQTTTKTFRFNLVSNQFSANASRFNPNTATTRYGFSATSNMNAILPAANLPYQVELNMASSRTTVIGVARAFGPSAQSVPEPSSIFALLGIAGLGAIGLLKSNNS